MAGSYQYFAHQNLSAAELYFFVALDETQKELGFEDLGAAAAILLGQNNIAVAGKLGGATAGTSVASLAARKLLPWTVRYRLPTITAVGVRGLRIAFTRNIGAFVGRAIPVVGTIMLATDVTLILMHTTIRYNQLAKPEDRIF